MEKLFSNLSKPNELTESILEKAELYRKDPFSLKLKPEYILVESALKESNSIETDSNLNENNKKSLELDNQEEESKLNHVNKKFKRGENKKNERKQLIQIREVRLCPFVAKCIECSYGSSCKYNHDIKTFIENKNKDIADTCYVFRKYGKCPFGLSCRFGSEHLKKIDENKYENVINTDLFKSDDSVCRIYNVLGSDLKTKLWKRQYNFDLSDKIVKTVEGYIKTNRNTVCNLKYHRFKGTLQKRGEQQDDEKESSDKEDKKAQNKANKLGSVTDEDLIKLRKLEKKKIDWKNKLYLAPLTTVGNLPYRRICKEFGADITCCEMAMSTNLLTGQASEWALLKKHESEDLFGVQLAGAYPDSLTKACQVITENLQVDFIDINSGCPIDLVFDKGSGCALMTRLDHFQKIIRSLDTLLDIPVTVKIRTGIKEDVLIAHDLIPELKTWGASMITLHGRTRQQRYSKLADWDYIEKCAKLSDPVPLFGCGDIMSYQEYNEHMLGNSISGCMLARGALYKPWLFTEIKEQKDWDISASERFEILKKYCNYGMEHWGSDSQGVETTRRFLLEWLSFLYRYIPVGLLEQVPQKINLRPPFFFCRNELETLMASPKSSDWIKITEMILGPVPDGFQFTPKHKANAY